MSDGKVSLKTPFMIENFNNINNFIMTIFPDIESYIKEQIAQGIHKSDLDNLVYYKLKTKFKLYIVRHYSKELDAYLDEQVDHVNREAIKDVLLSTISTTLNVSDARGHKLNENDYLISLKNIIEKFTF